MRCARKCGGDALGLPQLVACWTEPPAVLYVVVCASKLIGKDVTMSPGSPRSVPGFFDSLLPRWREPASSALPSPFRTEARPIVFLSRRLRTACFSCPVCLRKMHSSERNPRRCSSLDLLVTSIVHKVSLGFVGRTWNSSI